jgi:periplasmic copper chaperone A
MRRRTVWVVGISALLGLGVPSGALAHTGPNPSNLKAGSTTKVTFTVGHGCGAAPTVKAQLKVPKGFAIGKASGPKGWKASTKDGVVTWTGPAIAANKPFPLVVSLTAPKAADEYVFPIVQTCTVGKLLWTEVKGPGNEDPKQPAPLITVS